MISDELKFQLTASQGGWPSVAGVSAVIFSFQLTASQGGWLLSPMSETEQIHFNSQPHKEADGNSFQLVCPSGNFNSQPHKEADERDNTDRGIPGYFNSQPHKEADSWISTYCEIRNYFNSQPHKEADGGFTIKNGSIFAFQLTASQGGWLLTEPIKTIDTSFQLTASQGGWHVSIH